MSGGIALPFHDLRTEMGAGGQHHSPGRFTRWNEPVPIVQEAGWTPRPVCTGAEMLASNTGIRSPERPARSESLYRQIYPGSNMKIVIKIEIKLT